MKRAGGFSAGVVVLCALAGWVALAGPVVGAESARNGKPAAGADVSGQSEAARNGKPAAGADESGQSEAARNGKPVGAEVAGGHVRIVGPLAAKEMVEAIAAEFGKTGVPITLDYQRIDIPSVAAGALLAGRELMLSVGKLTEKDVSYSAARWKALAAGEHVIGARAVAIVVHERNPIDSLSLEQVGTIFSGAAREWSSFGGARSAIRCYGLAFGDPLTAVFHGRVLSAARCGMLVRKGNTAEVLSALAGDPHGIAFAEAGAAAVSGETVKVIAIGSAGAGQLEAARNGKPEAGAAGAEAARNGKPSSGAAPGSGASGASVAPNAQTIKDGTYVLAETLVLYISPKGSQAAQDFVRFILGGGGDATIRRHGYMPTLRAVRADALAAFGKLYGPDIKRVKATPDGADDLALGAQMVQSARTARLDAELLAAMCEQVYKAGGSPADGQRLVEALMTAADLGTSARSFAEAADAWSKALAVAEVVNAPGLAVLKERRPAFEARVKSSAEAASIAGRLRENPQDVAARGRMLTLQLLELDQPAEAARYLDAAADEGLKTNVPLACQPAEKLSEESALKLAEFVAAHPDLTQLGKREIGSARQITDLRPLERLTKLKTLELQQAGNLKDLSPLGRLASLESLTLANLEISSLASLSGLSKVNNLNLNNSRNLSDIAPIGQMSGLRALNLSGCQAVVDLGPLEKLAGNLTGLNLSGTKVDYIMLLAKMTRLKSLDLRHCDKIGAEDVARLAERLSNCKVQSDVLAKRP
jgi:ABC-type phosphate transport system substrate-binding protein